VFCISIGILVNIAYRNYKDYQVIPVIS